MSEGLNRWMGIGNLASDPELRMTADGQAILKLRLACNESYLDKSNTRVERTEFVSITIWGKRGEALAKILTKGSSLYVEGSLRTSSYEKDGEKRYRTEIVASNVILTGGRPAGTQGSGPGAGARPPRPPQDAAAPTAHAPQDDYGDFPNDDIPFVRVERSLVGP